MAERLKYAIFRTRWGYFGLLRSEKGLVRSCLPVADTQKAKKLLLDNIAKAESDTRLLADLQEKIKAYFDGSYVDFEDARLVLDGLTEFSRNVLTECRKVKYSQTISYSDLAKLAGRPKASRAIGNILAKNPLPLIIPCHRIIRAGRKIGGFSAPGGVGLKEKMLKLESSALTMGVRLIDLETAS
jgi:methylated-DNA-[protein]-cysteine S-methyltransferase